jgi:hypothetical protein
MRKVDIDTREFGVLFEGRAYELPVYTIKETGIQKTKATVSIPYVKGSIEGEQYKQDGIITENLLSMVAFHLKSLNVGELENRNTTLAIEAVETAVMRLEERKKERKARGVLGTYKK